MAASVSSASSAACWQDFKSRRENEVQNLESRYRKLDPEFTQLPEVNRPQLLTGRKRSAVMLIHGYMGSPDEMKGLARKLHEQGHSIYNALIPGFGATAKIANRFRKEEWSSWVRREAQALGKCFPKIHVVGFSTGGLLAYDLLSSSEDSGKVASAVFVSPYFETHNVFFKLLQSAGSWIFRTISVDTAYNLGVLDLEVMTLKREAYLQEVPVQAGLEVVDLGQDLRGRALKGRVLSIPALVFLSKDDLVINEKTAARIIQSGFESSSLKYYESTQRIPHHMMVPEVSPVADQVEKDTLQFIPR